MTLLYFNQQKTAVKKFDLIYYQCYIQVYSYHNDPCLGSLRDCYPTKMYNTSQDKKSHSHCNMPRLAGLEADLLDALNRSIGDDAKTVTSFKELTGK